jgi:lipopolysaccharide heptosyltransferase II
VPQRADTTVRWQDARRVLAVRMDNLGDVLMTTPALRSLRDAVPGRTITLLTSGRGKALDGLLPMVDEIIAFDAPWSKVGESKQGGGPALACLADELRRRRFDAAVIFTVFSQSALPSALLAYMADIPLRAAHCRENPYALLTTWLREEEREQATRHEVERQLALAKAIGGVNPAPPLKLEMYVQPAARRRVMALLQSSRLAGGRWLVIHPGASAPSRRYPAARFARIARTLSEQHGFAVALTGDRDEKPMLDDIAAAVRGAKVFAGSLDVGELAALIEAAPLLLSNNTGPAHIAAAVGTPIVCLYAMTNPQHMPWGVARRVLTHPVPCGYCYRSECVTGHHECLRGISEENVVDAVLDLWAETAPRQNATRGASGRGMRMTLRPHHGVQRVDRRSEGNAEV